jgi:hypothetical protein
MTAPLYTPSAQEIASASAAAITGEAGRIQRAAALVAAGAVSYLGEGLGWSVASQRSQRRQDPQEPEPMHYTVSGDHCGCYDYLNRTPDCNGYREPCKHILSIRIFMRVLANKFGELISNGGAYIVELSGGDYGLFDSKTDEPICSAVYVAKCDTYRPTDSAAAAAFAAWVAAQPVAVEAQPLAVEAGEYFPGGLLEKILRGAPEKVTLRADVIYGSPTTYILSGYRYDGGSWVRLEQDERQKFNVTAWNNLLAECGFIQPGRPVKQPGLAYNYLLVRGAADQQHYGLTAQAAEYVERQAVRKMFEADLNGEQV